MNCMKSGLKYLYKTIYLTVQTWRIPQIAMHEYQTGSPVDAGIYFNFNIQVN